MKKRPWEQRRKHSMSERDLEKIIANIKRMEMQLSFQYARKGIDGCGKLVGRLFGIFKKNFQLKEKMPELAERVRQLDEELLHSIAKKLPSAMQQF